MSNRPTHKPRMCSHFPGPAPGVAVLHRAFISLQGSRLRSDVPIRRDFSPGADVSVGAADSTQITAPAVSGPTGAVSGRVSNVTRCLFRERQSPYWRFLLIAQAAWAEDNKKTPMLFLSCFEVLLQTLDDVWQVVVEQEILRHLREKDPAVN